METNVQGIEVYTGKDGQWYWRARAANGEIVAEGEGYTRQDDARKGAGEVFPGIPIAGTEATEAPSE